MPTTPQRPRPSSREAATSPAEKRARVGEWVRSQVVDEAYNDAELRLQVNTLKAEVKTLTGAVSTLRDKHNALLEDTKRAFEMTWIKFDVCDKEMQETRNKFCQHTQGFLDVETYVKAQFTAAAEKMRMYEDDMAKLTKAMQDKASYVLDYVVPDLMEQFNQRTKKEMEEFQNSWMPKMFQDLENTVTANLGNALTKNLDGNLKVQWHGQNFPCTDLCFGHRSQTPNA